MEYRIPKSRHDLKILNKDTVLEVGGGHNPHPRSQLIVDKYPDSNYHRSGDIMILKKQKFIQADGEDLPFVDRQFDYVICSHVLEHTENPQRFLEEQFRVARRGYLETPSLVGEFLYPKKSHKWLILFIDKKLILVEKAKVNFQVGFDLGNLFQNYFPKNSIGYKIMQNTIPDFETVRIEWKNRFDYSINPDDPNILKYFQGFWDMDMVESLFPKKSMKQELLDTFLAMGKILKSVINSHWLANK